MLADDEVETPTEDEGIQLHHVTLGNPMGGEDMTEIASGLSEAIASVQNLKATHAQSFIA